MQTMCVINYNLFYIMSLLCKRKKISPSLHCHYQSSVSPLLKSVSLMYNLTYFTRGRLLFGSISHQIVVVFIFSA